MDEAPRRLVVAITGASGVIYGIRALEVLSGIPHIETHLIVSQGGKATIAQECDYSFQEIKSLAHFVHSDSDVGAPPASGSFTTSGMLVAPCSIKTMSAVANSYAANLIGRAADVTLKERRRLVLLVRETPLHSGHLHLMQRVAEIGGIIMPPVPAFYHRPASLDDVINHTVGRALDLFGVEANLFRRWSGDSRGAGDVQVEESAARR